MTMKNTIRRHHSDDHEVEDESQRRGHRPVRETTAVSSRRSWWPSSTLLVLYALPVFLLIHFSIVRSSLDSTRQSLRWGDMDRVLSPVVTSLDTSSFSERAARRRDEQELPSQGRHRSSPSLRPGDLPGYTGWARPAFTLAGWFEIIDAPVEFVLGAGGPWTATIACRHVWCRSGGALFDVRAYGPAIVPGTVQDHQDGTYTLSMYFFDEGSYTVEWVLAFSKPPPLDSYPRPKEVHYEGYLLPGFPLTLQVENVGYDYFASTSSMWDALWSSAIGSESESESSRVLASLPPVSQDQENDHDDDNNDMVWTACTMADILDSAYTSSIQEGRWLVVDRIDDPAKSAHLPIVSSSDELDTNSTNGVVDLDLTLEGYQQGLNSIGFRMAYERVNCTLPTLNEMRQQPSSRRRHVIFIGDSNMARQEKAFSAMKFANTETSMFGVNTGLQYTLASTIQKLLEAAEKARNESDTDYYIFFNAGLHEIAQMCRDGKWELFAKKNKIRPEDVPKCHVRYKNYLTELIHALQAFPAKLVVFQTTVSGWSKWGNYGFGWPILYGQGLPYANQFVEHFNQIAWDLMQEYKVPTVDGFWRSVSRPDHREVSADNEIGKHLVHMGPELYDLFMREWAFLMVETEKMMRQSEMEHPSPSRAKISKVKLSSIATVPKKAANRNTF